MATHTVPGWYGKLPATGDFLRQRLSETTVAPWSHWFQQGLMHTHQQSDANTSLFLRAPVWNFVLPLSPLRQQIQMGCLLPSCDRVGRSWPLLALQSFSLSHWHSSQLAMSGDWFQELGTLLLRGVRERLNPEALEQQMQQLAPLMVPDKQRSDIMEIIGFDDLPCTLSWQEVADNFDPQQHISYWWSNRSDGFAHATHKHSGPLTAQLFSLLFNPASGAQPGRNGLYPPMFE